MKVLFIAPYVPSRIRVRPFHLIRELARRHQVQVLALGEPAEDAVEGIAEIESCVVELRIVPHRRLRGYLQSLAALPTPTPMCAAFCKSPAMTKAVYDMMEGTRFDVVHVEHLRAAHFAPAGFLPVVFDAVDCLTRLFRQMARHRRNPLAKLVNAEESWKLRRYEPRVLEGMDRVVVTSDTERAALLALNPRLDVEVVPNGVDTDYFAPQGTPKLAHRVVFSGKMSYRPNSQAALWFAENVFPALRARWPDAEFLIVGSGPPAEVCRLAAAPGITVTGYVDDIRPYLDSCQAAVAPMQVAVGVQNKVLESMAMGLPVVATPMAVRPFGPDCLGVFRAAEPEEFVREVSGLLADGEAARRAGQEGRAAVRRGFSWQASAERLERIYEELVEDHARSAA